MFCVYFYHLSYHFLRGVQNKPVLQVVPPNILKLFQYQQKYYFFGIVLQPASNIIFTCCRMLLLQLEQLRIPTSSIERPSILG